MSPVLPLEHSKIHAALSRWFTEETHQGFFATDLELRVVVWNRWMEIHSGHSASEVVGRPLFGLFHDAMSRGVREYYENALAGHVTVISHGLHRFLLSMPPSNPDLPYKEMPQSGHIGPLSDGRSIIGTVTILEDVSDQLAGEAELRTQIEAQQLARATAEKALRAKDDFLSTLSHEMRTPLNAVLGWTRILRTREGVDRVLLDRALEVIERNGRSQAKMIDDMLDMSRIVAGKLRMEMQPIDLEGVILAAIDVMMPAATAKQLTVKTHLDHKALPVLGDPDRLQQIIWNLISNASKFTPPGGTIEVRLEGTDKFSKIVVSDTGQGISPEFLPHVFERFRQNDASSTRRQGGLGLGLALVRELVELHGGTVRAASGGLDKGATFIIELRTGVVAATLQLPLDSIALDQATPPSLAGLRVLVVDDEADDRELIVTALAHCGAQVTAVSSSADAVAAILSSTSATLPHVIVSDIGMPGEDGYALIRQVRALARSRGGRIPAIAVTSYASREDIAQARAAGYQRHVTKPMDPAALASVVAELAHRRN